MKRNQSRKPIPIRPDKIISEVDRLVADVAFNLWLSSAFRSSPEKALLASLEMLGKQTSAGLFSVPRRNSIPSDPYPGNWSA